MEVQTERYEVRRGSEMLGPEKIARSSPSVLLAMYDKVVLETKDPLDEFYIMDTKKAD